jgi:hypothetical protein
MHTQTQTMHIYGIQPDLQYDNIYKSYYYTNVLILLMDYSTDLPVLFAFVKLFHF